MDSGASLYTAVRDYIQARRLARQLDYPQTTAAA